MWVMCEWSVGAMRFQKIFGLYSDKRKKVEKWSGPVGVCGVSGQWVSQY